MQRFCYSERGSKRSMRRRVEAYMRTVKLFYYYLCFCFCLTNTQPVSTGSLIARTAWENAVWPLQLTSCEPVIANSFPESDANAVSFLPLLFVIKWQAGNQLVLGT
ncbi:hypothetical protein E3U43_007691 [Larimichthys crocea]|uniref:Uncharacterized protein n=1 Tax=Larimichthys crocea TaxID=215358 RepID=A0ACD3Q4S5_LARCR|nr:hypothetical protein E3U43_007691 [Larimichthys crocea]